jgi:hypothetical protein
MSDFLQLFGFFGLSFAGSVAVAWIWYSVRQGRRSAVNIPENASARVVSEGQVYRTRLIATTPLGLRFSAPMQQGHYVPVRQGAPVAVEAPTPSGVLRFRSTILDRDADSHSFLVAQPTSSALRERREGCRYRDLEDLSAWIDGEPCRIVDLSQWGARVAFSRPIPKGDRVLLRLGWMRSELGAWSLEALAGEAGSGYGHVARLRFEEAAELAPIRKEKTPA